MHARDISRKLKEKGAKKASALARSRRVLPYSANWKIEKKRPIDKVINLLFDGCMALC